MGKKHGSFRTTISVPADLKARMDRVNEPVNWSALACAAFEKKLAEIAAGKEKSTMNDVVERLRASIRSEEGEQFKLGYETGTKWAEHQATAAQLARLEAFQVQTKAKSQAEWQNWFRLSHSHKPWAEIVRVIAGDQNLRTLNVQKFWVSVAGEKNQLPNAEDFLRGFAEGAVDLWVRVQEQL